MPKPPSTEQRGSKGRMRVEKEPTNLYYHFVKTDRHLYNQASRSEKIIVHSPPIPWPITSGTWQSILHPSYRICQNIQIALYMDIELRG